MHKNLLLFAGLATLPLLSTAQTTPASPRFYVEAGVSILTDRGFRTYAYDHDPALVGPSLTFGTWLSPRLALQVGGAVARSNDNYSYSYYDNSGFTPTLITTTTDTRQTLYTLPVLLRYALTPNAGRLNVDALGGITVLHSTGHYSQTNNPSYYGGGYGYDYDNTKANLTLGPSLRYSLTSNLQVTADPLVNVTVDNESYSSFRNRLFWNFLVGAHYSFGQR